MQTSVRSRLGLAALIVAACLTAISSLAQQSATATTSGAVPNLVHYSGILKDVTGKTLTELSGVTFLLYRDQQGGAPLWMETQNVTPDASGHYEVQLGTTTASGIPTDLFQTGEARWLSIQIAGEAEQPRVMLVAVAYAMKAADAATIGGLPPSAFVLAPTASSKNASAGGAPSPTMKGQATASVQRSSSDGAKKTPGGTTPVTTAGGTVNFIPLWDGTSDLANSILFQNNAKNSRIGINTTTPQTTLDIKGTETVRGNLSLPAMGTATSTTSFNSQPLTFSASAFNGAAVAQNFRWQAEPTNNFGLISGSLNLLYASGSNAFGETGVTFDPFGDLRSNSLSANSVFGGSSVPGNGALFGLNSDTATASFGVLGETSSPVFGAAGVTGSGPGFGVVGYTSSTIASPGSGVLGWATATTGQAQGVQGFTNSLSGSGVYGVLLSTSSVGQSFLNPDFLGHGVWGDSGYSPADNFQPVTIAVLGTADVGVAGWFEDNANNFDAITVVALQDADDAASDAFYAGGPSRSCVITGSGDLVCDGVITGSAKNFRVDHPLDPANKYLNHSSVESSEMMNIYTGNVTTDARGEATVQLPDWFEAVNGDFRYQLTVIGQFAQAIISREIQNHEFAIKTSVPNVKVSWQVTGVRQDAWAKAHPLVVEEGKEAKQRGYYIHPELYGASNEQRIRYAQHPEIAAHMKRAKEQSVQDSSRAVSPASRRPMVPPALPAQQSLPGAPMNQR
jgi:hypothetical protein